MTADPAPMEFDTMPDRTGADRQFVAPPQGRPSRRPRWANARRVPPLLLLGAVLVLAMAAKPGTDAQPAQPQALASAQPVARDAGIIGGVTGTRQGNIDLAGALRTNAANEAALLKAGPAPDLPSGPLGIPGVALDAYKRAERTLAKQQPQCQLPWWLLAGIGKVESDHADGGRVDSAGTTLTPIVGPALDGTNGNVALPAVNGGQWTGDATWEHAVGPMQFLPSNWPKWGGSGDPNNIYDAALAAGKYLCSGGRNLNDPAQRAEAVFSYNQSNDYVRTVLIWANAYAGRGFPVWGLLPMPGTVSTAAPAAPATVASKAPASSRPAPSSRPSSSASSPVGTSSVTSTPAPVATSTGRPTPTGTLSSPTPTGTSRPAPPSTTSSPAPTCPPSTPTTTTTPTTPPTTTTAPPASGAPSSTAPTAPTSTTPTTTTTPPTTTPTTTTTCTP